MGIEIEINSLEDMCDLMCYNKIPRKKVRKVGDWIPVIEMLPEKGTLVLCTVRDEKHSVIITQYDEEQYWFDGKIVAWMPLPKPYIE